MAVWRHEEPSEEIKQLMQENGVSQSLFNYRTRYAKKKMSFIEAASTPPKKMSGSGKYGTAAKEAVANGIPQATFYSRLKNKEKWTVERAKTEPVQQKEIMTEADKAEAIRNGITVEQAKGRIRRGMSKKRAITQKVMKRINRKESIRIARENDIPRSTFNNRISLKWNEYKARTYPVGSLECLTLRQNKLMIERGLSHMAVLGRIKAGMPPEKAIDEKYIKLDKEKAVERDTSLKRRRARINGAPTVHMVEIEGKKQTVFCGYAMASDMVEVIDDTPAAEKNITCKWCKKYFEYGGR